MTLEQQRQEFNSNINLIIIANKLAALKEALSEEQLIRYNKSIEKSKKILRNALEDTLNPQQVDELLSAFDK